MQVGSVFVRCPLSLSIKFMAGGDTGIMIGIVLTM